MKPQDNLSVCVSQLFKIKREVSVTLTTHGVSGCQGTIVIIKAITNSKPNH